MECGLERQRDSPPRNANALSEEFFKRGRSEAESQVLADASCKSALQRFNR